MLKFWSDRVRINALCYVNHKRNNNFTYIFPQARKMITRSKDAGVLICTFCLAVVLLEK